MKNILLIGLGRFGKHVAMQLNELGHEVMAVDSNEERVNKVLDYVTNAQIGDSTNSYFLNSLGISNFDVCIVAIGSNFQNSLETTSLLKELGAKKVISRAERIMSWIMSRLIRIMPCLKWKCLLSGLARLLGNWMFVIVLISILSALRGMARWMLMYLLIYL